MQRKSYLWMALALLILPIALSASADPAAPWVTFRNGPQNHGTSTVSVRALVHKFSDRPVQMLQTQGLIWGTPVIDSQGRTWVGSADKRVYDLDPSGHLTNSFQINDRPDALIDSAAALLGADRVIVPGGDGFLHALDTSTGNEVWSFAANGTGNAAGASGALVHSFEGNVQIGPNGLIYAGSDDGNLYCVKPDGSLSWEFQTGMMIWSSPVFDPAGKWMAFGSLDGNVYVLNPETGALLVKYEVGSEVKASLTTDGQDNLYFGDADGVFHSARVVRAQDGSYAIAENWEFQTSQEIYSSAAIQRDRIVFGSLDGYFYCLNREGQLLWKFNTSSRIASSPLISEDGVALFGAKNGKLYAIDLASGTRIWSYRTSPSAVKVNLDSSPALSADGIVRVGSYGGQIFGVPYEFCLENKSASECEFGGSSDLPDSAQDVAKNSAVLRWQTSQGRLLEEPSNPLALTASVSLKLLVNENGDFPSNVAIDALSVSVQLITANDPNGTDVDWILSPDGSTLKITPRAPLRPSSSYHLSVSGRHFKHTGNWFFDRLQWFSSGDFQQEFDFETAKPGYSIFPRDGTPRVISWPIHSLYLTEPEALDTYTPAALDGQAFWINAFAPNPASSKFIVLATPALPNPADPANPIALADATRSFTAVGVDAGSSIRARGQFVLAAMGGEIPFDRLDVSSTVDPNTGALVDNQLTAVASCMGIKGNGSSFQFPSSLLDQVCDYQLRMVAFGRYESAPPDRQLIGGSSQAQVVSTEIAPDGDGGVLTVLALNPALTRADHLVSILRYDPNEVRILNRRSWVVHPGQWNVNSRLSIDLDSDDLGRGRTLIFLDRIPLKDLSGPMPTYGHRR